MKLPSFDIFNSKKVEKLNTANKELQSKTSELESQNRKIASYMTSMLSGMQYYTGENTTGELGTPNELIIEYETIRVRSWEFIIKNHMASLIINKRVNWTIGNGLLFNLKPELQPFIDFYGNEEIAKQKREEFVNEVEYKFRNFAKTTLADYSGKKNLHELARLIDYNACGDGDVLNLMRVKDSLPNVQVITGQAVIDPFIIDTDDNGNEPKKGNYIVDGVEFNEKGEIEAYHVQTYLINNSITKHAVIIDTDILKDNIGTKRIKAKFPGTDINAAWLYMSSDLQKIGETRALPLLSAVFETLKHLNNFLIANAKNAELLSQIAVVLQRTNKASSEPVFSSSALDSVNGTASVDDCTTDTEVQESANKNTMKLEGNGLFMDLPKEVEAKILNPQAQSNQDEFLRSTFQTLAAAVDIPFETLISAYNSNYTASMGSRSDFQHNLDVKTEVIPANQFYRKMADMFIYLQVLSGKINCPPLLKAYTQNDGIAIRAITNSTFEGTKLKPIDPLKFIKSIREQLPESVRESIPLDTIENLINKNSGNDLEATFAQVDSEIGKVSNSFKVEVEAPTSTSVNE
jgi:capsid protein